MEEISPSRQSALEAWCDNLTQGNITRIGRAKAKEGGRGYERSDPRCPESRAQNILVEALKPRPLRAVANTSLSRNSAAWIRRAWGGEDPRQGSDLGRESVPPTACDAAEPNDVRGQPGRRRLRTLSFGLAALRAAGGSDSRPKAELR